MKPGQTIAAVAALLGRPGEEHQSLVMGGVSRSTWSWTLPGGDICTIAFVEGKVADQAQEWRFRRRLARESTSIRYGMSQAKRLWRRIQTLSPHRE